MTGKSYSSTHTVHKNLVCTELGTQVDRNGQYFRRINVFCGLICKITYGENHRALARAFEVIVSRNEVASRSDMLRLEF